jgi:DNA-directed RNA polymerase subunit RPC12/RpoP
MPTVVAYRCHACHRLLFETDEPTRVVIKIRCRRCGHWNYYRPEPGKPA